MRLINETNCKQNGDMSSSSFVSSITAFVSYIELKSIYFDVGISYEAERLRIAH